MVLVYFDGTLPKWCSLFQRTLVSSPTNTSFIQTCRHLCFSACVENNFWELDKKYNMTVARLGLYSWILLLQSWLLIKEIEII